MEVFPDSVSVGSSLMGGSDAGRSESKSRSLSSSGVRRDSPGRQKKHERSSGEKLTASYHTDCNLHGSFTGKTIKNNWNNQENQTLNFCSEIREEEDEEEKKLQLFIILKLHFHIQRKKGQEEKETTRSEEAEAWKEEGEKGEEAAEEVGVESWKSGSDGFRIVSCFWWQTPAVPADLAERRNERTRPRYELAHTWTILMLVNALTLQTQLVIVSFIRIKLLNILRKVLIIILKGLKFGDWNPVIVMIKFQKLMIYWNKVKQAHALIKSSEG